MHQRHRALHWPRARQRLQHKWLRFRASAGLWSNSVESAVSVARLEKRKSDQTLFYVSGGTILLLLGAIVFAVINANSGPTEVAQNPVVHVPPEPHTPTKIEPVKPKVLPPKPVEPVKPKPIEPTPPPLRSGRRNAGRTQTSHAKTG